MQFLDTDGKLSAAKSCRRLSHAARHPFAWKDSRPLMVTVRQLVAVSSASPLLRLPPLSLHLEHAIQALHLTALVQLPPSVDIRELHVDTRELYSNPRVSDAQWSQLLASPALQSLQVVRTEFQSASSLTLQLLAQLPQLHSLYFRPVLGSDLTPLTAAPQLTHLSVQIKDKDLEGMQAIGQCLQLRSLRLVSWANCAQGMRQLFTAAPSPQQRLQRLELGGLCARPDPEIPVATAEEMCQGLAAMRHLTELRLRSTHGIKRLLACLHAAPALRLLEVELGERHPSSAFGSTHPTPEALHALLERAPQLRVRLLLVPSVDKWLESARRRHLDMDSYYAQQWYDLRRDFSAMPRVAIVDPDG